MLGTLHRDGVGTPPSPAQAATWFGTACDGFDPLGCLEAGKMYDGTRGLPRDDARAGAYLERACAAGLSEGCELGGERVAGPGTVTSRRHGCACAVGEGLGGGDAAPWVVVALVVVRRRRQQKKH
ncbi:MAG: hypothetical protein R2939_13800 [Kofleriaceae bacterium]